MQKPFLTPEERKSPEIVVKAGDMPEYCWVVHSLSERKITRSYLKDFEPVFIFTTEDLAADFMNSLDYRGTLEVERKQFIPYIQELPKYKPVFVNCDPRKYGPFFV